MVKPCPFAFSAVGTAYRFHFVEVPVGRFNSMIVSKMFVPPVTGTSNMIGNS